MSTSQKAVLNKLRRQFAEVRQEQIKERERRDAKREVRATLKRLEQEK